MYYELLSLLLMGALSALIWFPASVGKGRTFGIRWLAGNREPMASRTLPEWAARAERAQKNLLDYLPAFIIAVLVLASSGGSTAHSATACLTFAGARYLHALVYMLGWPIARATVWAVSMGALGFVYYEALLNLTKL